MIIDCFPFFNELDLLEIRLNILDNVVNKFVLVEASKTQTKLNKPFYFEENKHRFQKFLDKIIHIKIEDYPIQDGWAMENFQRNCITKGINILNLKDDDIIAISDIDEIWNPDISNMIHNMLYLNESISIDMSYRVFYLNLETVNKRWIGTNFIKFSSFKNMVDAPQRMRNSKDHVLTINNQGWHFGYQGGKEKVYEKWLSCIEPLDKSKLPDKDIFFQDFDRFIKDNGYFIYSDSNKKDIKLIKTDISTLPLYIQKNIDLYKYMVI